MSEIIEVDCQHCGEAIPFEVEDWASPPERAFCGETCYSDHQGLVTPSPQATMA